MSSRFGWLLLVVATAGLYFATAKLGLSLAVLTAQVSAVWPPTGFALAAVVVFGYRIWPGIAIGAFLANATANEPLPTAAGIAIGNTLEAVIGAWLLARVVDFRPSLARLKDAVGLIVLAALLSTTVSATIGTVSLCLGGVQPWSMLGPLWIIWWLGDAVGALVVAPPLLTWAAAFRTPRGLASHSETVALIAGAVTVSALVFMGEFSAVSKTPLAYLIFPLVIWAALRQGPPMAATVTLLVSCIAVWGTAMDLGPFARGEIQEGLIRVQSFTGVVAVTSLLLGAAMNERRHIEEALRFREQELQSEIGERRKLERRLLQGVSELADAERRTRSVVDNVVDGIITIDSDGIVDSLNPAAETIFGYPAADVVGQNVKMLMPEPYRSEHDTYLSNYLTTGVAKIIGTGREVIGRRKDGSTFPMDLAVSEFMFAGRTYFTGVVRDITSERRVVQTSHFLADASAELAAIVDYESTLQKVAQLAVPFFADWCAVHVVGNDGRLQRLAIAHVDTEKAELASATQHLDPPLPGAPPAIAAVIEAGQSKLVPEISEAMLAQLSRDEQQLKVLKKLGLKSYLSVPIALRDKILGALTFAAAESGRRYTPADLDVANDLAHRVGIAIENSRLYTELRLADRRKDEFLAMLAHELRNPLAPIRNGLDLLALSGQADETLNLMREQVEHLVRLVDDLLDASRIMQGKIRIRKQPVELAAIIERSVEATRSLIEAQQHQLDVSIDPEPIWIDADPVRLAQIITNLLNNAAKYTDPGGHIWLNVEREADFALISFRDTGVGIDKELLPRVFDLFAQADRSLERSQGGLGIGLTLVRNLVELHHGTVSVSSDGPEGGSVFTVRLPVCSRAEQTPDEPETVLESQRRRILIVDDNTSAASMLKLLLQQLADHEILIAHDGPTALAMAGECPPDLILLDIGLPGMNGFEVARNLRQRSELDQTVIVALTGYGSEDDRRRSLESGFDVHLVKPAPFQELERVLQHPRLSGQHPKDAALGNRPA